MALRSRRPHGKDGAGQRCEPAPPGSGARLLQFRGAPDGPGAWEGGDHPGGDIPVCVGAPQDRKSTRLNSSHVSISYAVFCLKKKTMGWKSCQEADNWLE